MPGSVSAGSEASSRCSSSMAGSPSAAGGGWRAVRHMRREGGGWSAAAHIKRESWVHKSSRLQGVCVCGEGGHPDKLCRCKKVRKGIYSEEIYRSLQRRGGPIWERTGTDPREQKREERAALAREREEHFRQQEEERRARAAEEERSKEEEARRAEAVEEMREEAEDQTLRMPAEAASSSSEGPGAPSRASSSSSSGWRGAPEAEADERAAAGETAKALEQGGSATASTLPSISEQLA